MRPVGQRGNGVGDGLPEDGAAVPVCQGSQLGVQGEEVDAALSVRLSCQQGEVVLAVEEFTALEAAGGDDVGAGIAEGVLVAALSAGKSASERASVGVTGSKSITAAAVCRQPGPPVTTSCPPYPARLAAPPAAPA